MPKFIARFNVEFSTEIEADNAEQAVRKSEDIDTNAWDQKSTSTTTAEEVA